MRARRAGLGLFRFYLAMSLALDTALARRTWLRSLLAARLAAWLGVGLITWLGAAGRVEASGNVQRVVVNADTKAGTAGYTLEIDTRWSDLGGYRPVRVSITPHAAASVDTVFSVQFRATGGDYGRGTETIVVDQKMVVPPATEGSQPPPTTATVSVPQYNGWEIFSLLVWENGEFRPKLSVENVLLGNSGLIRYRGGNQAEALALVVDSKATVPPNFPTANVRSGSQVESLTITPRELPERWIDLSSIDVVCLKLAELEDLAKNHATKWQALRSWVAAGGNLWVTDVAKAQHEKFAVGQPPITVHWNRMTELERLLDVPPHERKAGAWANVGHARTRDLHLGQVVALPEQFGLDPRWQRPFQDGLEQTATHLNPHRLFWELRYGVNLRSPNSDFWNFLIPGVGLVPVMPFQVLITLFVVVIGPLNYVYLRRRAKLHLLIVTVPACALVVTLGLFGYALATDGLGVRVRVRSYTEIDQRRGEAVCWSRLCYYAGLAPSQGLRFSGDTVVLPIDPRIDDPTGGITRQLKWTGDGDAPLEQHLRGGWLRSRNLTQYLTQRARKTQAHLQITQQSDGRLAVVNRLETAIRYLAVCDADGKKYGAENVAADASVTLEADAAGSFDAVRQHFLRAFEQHYPKRPKGLNEYDLIRGRFRYYPMAQRTGSVRRLAAEGDDRLESGLAEAQRRLAESKLAPRTYVAIVERSPEVELGVAAAREEASFHVILGRW